jgi:photosynthetic reaction center H subunit
MYNLEFFGTFDATALVLTTFVLFFAGLVLYLRREDRREGYPLEGDASGRLEGASGLFFTATPKIFILGDGEAPVIKPNADRETPVFSASRRLNVDGAPLLPVGDPMLAKVGPGAFAQRARVPDMMLHGGPKIVPIRVAPEFSIDGGAASDPRGMAVVGADGRDAGVVSDVWVDKAEYLIRYLEVELGGLTPAGLSVVGSAPVSRRVLLPMTMAVVDKGRRIVRVDAILASQFDNVPALENPSQVTLDEEERICAYYGGGLLYATPMRAEPLI